MLFVFLAFRVNFFSLKVRGATRLQFFFILTSMFHIYVADLCDMTEELYCFIHSPTLKFALIKDGPPDQFY